MFTVNGPHGPDASNNKRKPQTVCATCDKFHAASSLLKRQDCLMVQSRPGAAVLACGHFKCDNKGHCERMSQSNRKNQ